MVSSKVGQRTEAEFSGELRVRMPRLALGFLVLGWVVVALCTSVSAIASPSITIFESGQVRPLEMSSNGQLLYAVNTADNRLEIFAVRPMDDPAEPHDTPSWDYQ